MDYPTLIRKPTIATNKYVSSNRLRVLTWRLVQLCAIPTYLPENFHAEYVWNDFLSLLVYVWVNQGNIIIASDAISESWLKMSSLRYRI